MLPRGELPGAEERDERGSLAGLLDRLVAPLLLAVHDHQRTAHHAAGLARPVDRRDQARPGGEDVVHDADRGPLLDERALDPLLQAVPLGFLADEEAGPALAGGPTRGRAR